MPVSYTIVENDPAAIGSALDALFQDRESRQSDLDTTPAEWTVRYDCGHEFPKLGILEDIRSSSLRFKDGVQHVPMPCSECLDLQPADNLDLKSESEWLWFDPDAEFNAWLKRVMELLGDDWDDAMLCIVGNNENRTLRNWFEWPFEAARVAGNLQLRVDNRREQLSEKEN